MPSVPAEASVQMVSNWPSQFCFDSQNFCRHTGWKDRLKMSISIDPFHSSSLFTFSWNWTWKQDKVCSYWESLVWAFYFLQPFCLMDSVFLGGPRAWGPHAWKLLLPNDIHNYFVSMCVFNRLKRRESAKTLFGICTHENLHLESYIEGHGKCA